MCIGLYTYKDLSVSYLSMIYKKKTERTRLFYNLILSVPNEKKNYSKKSDIFGAMCVFLINHKVVLYQVHVFLHEQTTLFPCVE